MKDLANEYSYSANPEESRQITAVRENRCYKTKMVPSDLPEHYCDVHRCWWTHNLINTKGVVDLKYKWVKINHFMKDSMLLISYTDKIEEYYPEYEFCGEKRTSIISDYTNVGARVWGPDIFKCLAYVRKYSDYDLTPIKEEFVQQCEWLKENEPEFAPDTSDFGEWFEDRLKGELEQ